MSTQKPNDNLPQKNDTPDSEDVDQSEALKRAILKLKESGMLTHVPDDLAQMTETHKPPSQAEKPVAQAKAEEPKPEKTSHHEDVTIASRPKPESPTIASADDVEKHADERAKWAAVMSGWEDGTALPTTNTDSSVTVSEETINKAGISSVSTDDDWALPIKTEPSRPSADEPQAITIQRKEIKPKNDDTALTGSREQTPWTLQQFFDGEIDLEQELLKRFPHVPAMTSVKFRTLGVNSGRKVATLSTQDGSASIIIDADVATKVVQLSFTFGSMMTLRYALSDIPANNRERWLELMRREKGGLAFLWNEERWREDYLICISREYATNIFAFSPRNFESAVRITKDVTKELLDWLEEVWTSEPEAEDDDDSPLLTW